MESGGEEKGSCSFNDYKRDHLATVGDSSKKTEETERKWLACGFNGFGQLKFENKRKLLQFEEVNLPESFINADNILLACSWNCLAIASECFFHLQGFLTNSTNSVKSIQTESPIKLIDICDKFCLFLTDIGKVYKIAPGSNNFNEVKFQLNLTCTPQKRNIFGKHKDNSLKISHIACGNNIAVAVSATNSVFNGNIEIFQFPKHQRIKQLKCGFEHALLLTSNGDVYAWGNGLRGQLGFEVLRVEETPTLIEALAGIKITSIAAGGWHSAAISAFDDVYTWGFNSNGQLSLRVYKSKAELLKEPAVYPLPQLIDVPCCKSCNKSCYPVNIAAGARHTVLQLNCGAIFVCGWNEYGQLGLENFQTYCDNFEFVLKLKDLKEDSSKKIICGNWCTLVEK